MDFCYLISSSLVDADINFSSLIVIFESLIRISGTTFSIIIVDVGYDTFIAANSWAIDSWNWLMGEIGLGGSTLVDIVNKIWNLSANAVQLVKDAVETVVNAVKAGLEYLADAVLIPIIDGYVTFYSSFFDTIYHFIVSQNLGFSGSYANGRITFGNDYIEVSRSGYDLQIVINDLKFSFGEIYILPYLNGQLETLTVGEDMAETDQILELGSWLGVATSIIATAFDYENVAKILLLPFVSAIFLKTLSTISLTGEIQQDYVKSMFYFHMTSFVGFAFSYEIGYRVPDLLGFILSNIIGTTVPLLLLNEPITATAFGLGFAINLLGLAAAGLGKVIGINIAAAINLFLMIYNLVLTFIYLVYGGIIGVDFL